MELTILWSRAGESGLGRSVAATTVCSLFDAEDCGPPERSKKGKGMKGMASYMDGDL